MFRPLIVALALAGLSLASAQSVPHDSYADGREIIADLDRIVAPTGVQESFKLRIGGIDQWVYVRGQDRSNPIILFVHGGPASPLAPTLWQFQRPLEEYFTIVHYDQRGAGKTHLANDQDVVSPTIRIQQYVDDAIELAQATRQRYGVSKLILMAHSWGTVIGLKAALTRPDLFHAYVGIGQVINTRTNEQVSFDYGLRRARAERNLEAIRELESIMPYPGDQPITRDRIIVARKWPQHYGGLTAFREESTYFFQAPFLSPQYEPNEIASVTQGNQFTLERILPEFMGVDYTTVERFPVPVLMFMGRHDYTTPSQPTADWLDKVRAPYKRGVWFERSAHMIPWEEPGKLLMSLNEYVRPLVK
jgi:pimeloyl-ACP methyl ester carboxylesterase